MADNTFNDQMAGMGLTARDTIRKQAAQAVSTGASRGMQSANEVSAMLGLEQSGVAEATLLMQNRQKMTDEMIAEKSKNAGLALTTSNAAKMGLGGLSSNLYAADTQFDVGQLDYFARQDAAAKALEGQNYTADQNLTGTKYNADKVYKGNVYSADAGVDAAKASAAAYAKNSGYTGGGGSGSTGGGGGSNTVKPPAVKPPAGGKVSPADKAIKDFSSTLGKDWKKAILLGHAMGYSDSQISAFWQETEDKNAKAAKAKKDAAAAAAKKKTAAANAKAKEDRTPPDNKPKPKPAAPKPVVKPTRFVDYY
jgi:hypothetical protein